MRHKNHKNGKPQPGRLRIVAGKWRSRLLPVANVEGLRPTSERIRETLFNWLAPAIVGSTCLDLFAGSGALGLEALSRGAASVLFVERSKTATIALDEYLVTLSDDHGAVRQADALSFLRGAAPAQYDLVFLDPPFASDMVADLCRLLAKGGWLKPGAHIYLEQDKKQSLPELPDGWQALKEKTTGNVRYSLIRVL
ncbi:MAG: 16S rRNA (guanine(966)-N(2))-methyltransferase RsmD [Woeseia sp.]|nr:16S rRNA (guanine(966)-N(2))-methyltransferase RsmD [Woeseia sp.]MBT6209512.1 16S rRNA (guanine(966)-N(2))-methyltransferase RsmD [Woeseia sp.]